MLPLSAFENLSNKRLRKRQSWFDTKGIPLDTFHLIAEIVRVQNVSYTKELEVILGSTRFPVNVNHTLATIGYAMSRQWVIHLENKKYMYDVNFGKKQNFDFPYKRHTKDLLGNETISTKIYQNIFRIWHLNNFVITKMYFCEQVALHPREWTHPGHWMDPYNTIRLNLTGKDEEKILGNNEFNYVVGVDGSFQNVQICVDDFNPKHAAVNRAYAVSVASIYSVILVFFWHFS